MYLRQKGTTSIEFALGAIVLFFTTFMTFEICYKIYVINITEYALRETLRNTKVYEGGGVYSSYQTQFFDVLNQDGKLWTFLINDNKFEVKSKYFKTYQDFVNNVSVSDDVSSPKYQLSEVTLTYHYTPMFNFSGNKNQNISRTMVLNLEHEGWIDDEEK